MLLARQSWCRRAVTNRPFGLLTWLVWRRRLALPGRGRCGWRRGLVGNWVSGTAPPQAGAELVAGQQPTLVAPVQVQVPTRRTVWRIVVSAVGGTVLMLALAVAAYSVYHQQSTEISSLKRERQQLLAEKASVQRQLVETRQELATVQASLGKTKAKLATSTRRFSLAKQNLTKLSKDLRAANARSAANYSAGYSAGTNEGYSTGHNAGLVDASDSLTCSDDPDVTWLPYCG
jgi:hypothetical protein